MSKKQIFIVATLFTLLAGGFYMAYRGVQLYHELTRPPVAAPTLAAAPLQPGKLITTVTCSVVREVVAPPVPVSHRPPHRRR